MREIEPARTLSAGSVWIPPIIDLNRVIRYRQNHEEIHHTAGSILPIIVVVLVLTLLALYLLSRL